MANEYIESRLKKLTKDELIILSRMLGIKTGFSFFQKEANLVNGILRKDKSDIEKWLNLISILKASDPDWLRRAFEFELGIRKETSAEKASEILSQENLKTIKKFAGKVQYEGIVAKIFPKGLSLSIIIGCLATFIVSFYADFGYVAAAVSIVALGFVLFTAAYASPLALGRFKVIEEWRFIVSIIVVLIFGIALYGTYQSYPEFEQKDLISNWAGNVATIMGFILGAVLYVWERPKLENWWRKHAGKVMVSIIFMVVLGYIYVDNCIIAGRVVLEDTKTEVEDSKKKVESTKIRIRGVSGIQDWLCCDEPSEKEVCDTIKEVFQSSNQDCDNLLKDKKVSEELEFNLKKKYKDKIPTYIKKESDPMRKNKLILELLYPDKIPMKEKPGLFYENFIKNNKLCTTTTNDNGDFSFRFFPVALESKQVGFQFKYEEKIYNEFRDIKLGVKKIDEFKVSKITGIWKCKFNNNEYNFIVKYKTDKKDKLSVALGDGTQNWPNNCPLDNKYFSLDRNSFSSQIECNDISKVEIKPFDKREIIYLKDGFEHSRVACE
ncbi:MAG: hypothetical protein BWK80_16835 [Desulfobacteraceae bacterium IS3]|nr:MAG: hypothetical protein BWK80_16835 [Desulfobacteraceae bacterium IS3]